VSLRSKVAEMFRRVGNAAHTLAERISPSMQWIEDEPERPADPASLGELAPIVELSPKAREMVEAGLHPPPRPKPAVGDRSPTATPEPPVSFPKPAAGARVRSWRG